MVNEGGLNLCVATIEGSGFLWHQIRYTMTVLFKIGEGSERLELIDALLNPGEDETRPIFEMASEKGLILWDCKFDGVRFKNTLEGLERAYELIRR